MPYPNTLALVEDDRDFGAFLAQYLRNQDIKVDIYEDSNELLTDPACYKYDFYVVDLMLPGIDGLDLIKVLRRRSDSGLLVVSGRLAQDVFTNVIAAGADMYLAKPVQFDQIGAAISGVYRRAQAGNGAEGLWRLDRQLRELIAPEGTRIALSATDMALLECFLEARGRSVSLDVLRGRLGHPGSPTGDEGLTATIYRLRRRIERATPTLVPIHAKSRVGYIFRAPLSLV
jgi:DNA-binding response OmpR family regulator